MAKKLAEMGWNVANPKQNGLVIPSKLPNGIDPFHGNHPAYNEWMGKIGEKIVLGGEDHKILDRMKKLNKFTTDLLEKAYTNNSSINKYWKESVGEVTKETLKLIDEIVL